jgi:hypothetical protein
MPIKINGATSGYVQLSAPDVAGNTDLTLPSGTGTLLTAEGGKVLQIVRATDSTARSTTSTSFVDVTGMTVTITPQKSTSAILLICTGRMNTSGPSNADNLGVLQITDSGNTAISGAEAGPAGNYQVTHSSGQAFNLFNIMAYATPATTSAVTYKMRFKADAASITVYIDNFNNTGQMFAIEVSA